MNHFKIITILLLLTLTFNLSLSAGNIINTKKKKNPIMDIIHVNGMVLKGKILDIGSDKLSFKLMNISGINYIPYKDIDAIHTHYNYNISYKNENISGKIVEVIDGESLKVENGSNTRVLKIADIDSFALSLEDDNSVENYARNKLPYISGNINLGLEFENGASIKNKTHVNIELLRKKLHNEIYFYFDYAYETTETSTTPKTDSKDEMRAILGDRYFYDTDNFLYAGVMAEYDHPRDINARYVPDIGYGHKFRLGRGKWIQSWLGVGYVWTRYEDEELYPDDKFVAATIGLNGAYQFENLVLINKLKIDGEIIYYPSITNPSDDWIMRSKIGFTIPIYEFFSIKLAIQWINDSNPNPSIGNNKTKTNLSFGVNF